MVSSIVLWKGFEYSNWFVILVGALLAFLGYIILESTTHSNMVEGFTNAVLKKEGLIPHPIYPFGIKIMGSIENNQEFYSKESDKETLEVKLFGYDIFSTTLKDLTSFTGRKIDTVLGSSFQKASDNWVRGFADSEKCPIIFAYYKKQRRILTSYNKEENQVHYDYPTEFPYEILVEVYYR
jgi:hypothetical protein